MLYSLFLYGVIDWLFKNISFRNKGTDRMDETTYAERGVVESVHVLAWGSGSNVCHFGAYP